MKHTNNYRRVIRRLKEIADVTPWWLKFGLPLIVGGADSPRPDVCELVSTGLISHRQARAMAATYDLAAASGSAALGCTSISWMDDDGQARHRRILDWSEPDLHKIPVLLDPEWNWPTAVEVIPGVPGILSAITADRVISLHALVTGERPKIFGREPTLLAFEHMVREMTFPHCRAWSRALLHETTKDYVRVGVVHPEYKRIHWDKKIPLTRDTMVATTNWGYCVVQKRKVDYRVPNGARSCEDSLEMHEEGEERTGRIAERFLSAKTEKGRAGAYKAAVWKDSVLTWEFRKAPRTFGLFEKFVQL